MGRFDRLTFESFKELALDPSLCDSEKIGFDREYRTEAHIEEILYEISLNLDIFTICKRVLDIGCGCSGFTSKFINLCGNYGHALCLVDSEEVLSLLPNEDFVTKIAGRFPDEVNIGTGSFDAILVYSVLQHVILDMNPFTFIDSTVSLLAPGGRVLLGDIPNLSHRNRNSNLEKITCFNDRIDDSILISIVSRYRACGFNTYILPQGKTLPLCDTREHILIERPL